MTSLLTALLLFFAAAPALAQPAEVPSEQRDRQVDRIALIEQEKAIAQYKALAARFRGTEREPVLLMAVFDACDRAASLEFRIAHGKAAAHSTEPDMRAYNSKLQEMAKIGNDLITRYPNIEEIDRIYFKRGQAYHEIQRHDLAKQDFLYVAEKGRPKFAIKADMSLADYAIEADDPRTAINYLKRVEADPKSSFYPFALYKLAWCNYNLKDYEKATSYLVSQVDYYRKINDDYRDLTKSERALVDQSLLDYSLFYFTAFEEKVSGYEFSSALSKFRKVEKGEGLGKMTLRLAKLLRTREFTDELMKWKAQLLDEETGRPETLGVVTVTLEYLWGKKLYDKVDATLEDFKRIDSFTKHEMRKFENYVDAQKELQEVAIEIQKANATNPAVMGPLLAHAYESLTSITDDQDPNAPQVHNNFAESLFMQKHYNRATSEYQWVLAHPSPSPKLTPAIVKLKLIGSRYQALLAKDLVPKDLKPMQLAGEKQISLDKLNPAVREWIVWLIEYGQAYGGQDPAYQGFLFEADRAMYASGQTFAVVQTLVDWVKNNPTSKYAIPAMSLVMDTCILSQQWDQLILLAEALLRHKAFAKGALHDMLLQASADAAYKRLEHFADGKDYNAFFVAVPEFLDKYGSNPRVSDCLLLASRVALETNDKARSREYLDTLLKKFPKSSSRAQAFLARGTFEEGDYDFKAAIDDYDAFVTETSKDPSAGKTQALEAAKRIFLLSWIAKVPQPIDCTRFKTLTEVANECDRSQGLVYLRTGVPKGIDMVDHAVNGPSENRAVWAAVALQADAELSFAERLKMVSVLSSQWSTLEPLAQFATIASVNNEIPKAFALSRKDLAQVSPLKPDSIAIKRRIKAMGAIEETAGNVLKMPWAYPRVVALTEVAKVYLEFAESLSHLPPPKGVEGNDLRTYQKSVEEIADPFRKKGTELAAQAISLGKDLGTGLASVTALPSAPTRQPAAAPEPIDIRLVDRLQPSPDPREKLRPLWAEAIQSGAWGRSAYLMQEYLRKSKPSESTVGLMKAVALQQVGAETEALAELEAVKPKLEADARDAINRVLVSHYSRSLAPEKAEPALKEIKKHEQKKPAQPKAETKGGTHAAK